MSSNNSSPNHGYDSEHEIVKRDNLEAGASRTRLQRALAGQPVGIPPPLPGRRSSKRVTTRALSSLSEENPPSVSDDDQPVFSPRSPKSVESLDWDAHQYPLYNSSAYSVPGRDNTFNLTGNNSTHTPSYTTSIYANSVPSSPEFVDACEQQTEQQREQQREQETEQQREQQLEQQREQQREQQLEQQREQQLEQQLEQQREQEVSTEPPSDVSATPQNSVIDVEAMEQATSITEHKSNISLLDMTVEDDINPVRIDRVTLDFLKQRIQQAEEWKGSIRESIVYLSTYDETFTGARKNRANDIRAALTNFVNNAQERVAELEKESEKRPRNLTEAANVQSRSIKAQSVDKYASRAMDEIDTIVKELKKVVVNEKIDQAEFRRQEEAEKALSKRVDTARADANRLRSDAIEAGMSKEALELEEKARELNEEHVKVVTEIMDEKRKRNLTTTSSSNIFRGSDVSPPTFSGDPSDKSDFFKFNRDLEQYAAVKNPSTEELLRVILTKCLKGEAAAACEHMKDKDEVMTYLRSTYGNVKILINQQIGEIRKLGSCSGNEQKMRTWALAIKAKLAYVQALAEEHDLETELYHSNIAAEIQNKLPIKIQDDFLTELESKEDGKELSKPRVFKELVSYIETLIRRCTYRLNLCTQLSEAESTNSKPSEPRFKPASTQQNKEVTKNATKKSYTVSKNSKKGKEGNDKNEAKDGAGPGSGPGAPKPMKKYTVTPKEVDCNLCKQDKHMYLYYCKKFQEADITDRFTLTWEASVCFKCLLMNSETDQKEKKAWFTEHRDNCSRDWVCKQGRCNDKPKHKQMNFLLCVFHVKANAETTEKFVKTLDKSKVDPSKVKFFFNVPMMVNWCFTAGHASQVQGWETLDDACEPAIFMLTYVLIDNMEFLVFFDSGCMTASISEKAAKMLKTENVRPGPTDISVASGQTITLQGGEERFSIPLSDGKTRCTITALCMPEVTSEFPVWELEAAETELNYYYNAWYPHGDPLPKAPNKVGGTPVDIMLGSRYLKWFPRLRYMLDSGLAMYQSVFLSPNGKEGIIGGPHNSWRHLGETAHLLNRVYTVEQSLDEAPVHEPDLVEDDDVVDVHGDLVDEHGLQGEYNPDEVYNCFSDHCNAHTEEIFMSYSTMTNADRLNRFLEGDNMGTTVEYRCTACRNCSDCKRGDRLESLSLLEEREQHLIEQSLRYDESNKKLFAKLPFIADPEENLFANFHIAKKIFESQMKMASNDSNVRRGMIESHKKLADRGHVCKIENLSEDLRKKILETHGYVIPWRTVAKENSISTPVRIVYDASSRTPGGSSLNQILAKGSATLASLFSILLKFRLRKSAFSADVSMAYNGIQIEPEHVAYQKFLWKTDMVDTNPLETWAILTLIYGVRPSGNQMIEGFRRLGEHALLTDQARLAGGAYALMNDTYMDDVLSANDSVMECEEVASQLKNVLELGSMSVKDITFSGQSPSEAVSSDGTHVGALGMLWDSEKDTLKADIGELYLGKKVRGKTPEIIKEGLEEKLSGKFTRRVVVGKVSQVYDPLGLLVPITAKYKLHLHDLCKHKLDWDDPIPKEYLQLWCDNINEIQTLGDLYFSRSVVPPDAESPNLSYIVSCDASQEICICSVHSRIKKMDGSYHVQLVAAKSKIVTNLTVPRAELKGAVLAASLAHTVKRDSEERLRDVIYVTDSTICLYWMTQDQRPLQTGVRNAVLEIRRLSDPESWFHVKSEDNVADIGTRSTVPVDLSPGSDWISGKKWMKEKFCDMPLQTVDDITLNSEQKREAAQELKAPDLHGIVLSSLISKVGDRHSFSKYVLDPNRFSWPKSVRVLSAAFKFIDNCIAKCFKRDWTRPWFPDRPANWTKDDPHTTSYNTARAANYFFIKATNEVKKFGKKEDWKDCQVGKDGILYSTSRILEGQVIENQLGEGLDVDPLMFVKPVTDRYSPVSYSIMSYSHVVLARHRNVSETLRESRQICFVVGGRDLAIEIREACPFCKRYKARLLKRSMGKLHDNRFVIAPPFNQCQVDIFGPLVAICEHQHRSSVKVWGLVFKDPCTGAVSVHCMQKYDTPAFVMCYTRFSSRFGHPQKIVIDAGSQLVKAVNDMEISIMDAQGILKIQHQVGVQFEIVPVGSHYQNGQVERSIKEVKNLFVQLYAGLRHDILSYETAFQWISNELNCFPQCLGSRTSNLDNLDIITPARLMHGRNNRRALSGPARIDMPSRLMKQVDETTKAWFDVWTKQRIQDYIPKPRKWKESAGEISVGDIVVVLRKPTEMCVGEPVWKIGRVSTVNIGRDGECRSLEVEYRNPTEKTLRTVTVSARQVAVLHHEGDLELVDVLNEASKNVNVCYFMNECKGIKF